MTAIKIRVTVQIRYLAPEVMERQGRGTTARGGGYDGAAADMWSVGIVLFVLLSGTQPANSNFEHKRSVCSFDDNEVWHGISLEAKGVILKLTSIDALRRPSDPAAPLDGEACQR